MVCMLIIILIIYCWYEQCLIEKEEAKKTEDIHEKNSEKPGNKAA